MMYHPTHNHSEGETVGIRDELQRDFGSDFFRPTNERAEYHNWQVLCTCGHLSRYHAPAIGGIYEVPPDGPTSIGGQPVTRTTVFTGCVGAMPGRGFETETRTFDRASSTLHTVLHATCPCTELRPVAKVDKPNRYFNQRLPRDLADPARHPFQVGIRAFTKHLSKRRAALSDPSWADREFDRRFHWLHGARVCAIAKCTTTDGVWPVLINDDGLSELRCPAHR